MAGEVYISGGCPLIPPFTQDRGGGCSSYNKVIGGKREERVQIRIRDVIMRKLLFYVGV